MMDEEMDFKELFEREIAERLFAWFGFLKQSCYLDGSGVKACWSSFCWATRDSWESGEESSNVGGGNLCFPAHPLKVTEENCWFTRGMHSAGVACAWLLIECRSWVLCCAKSKECNFGLPEGKLDAFGI